jgi:hypothetical protein
MKISLFYKIQKIPTHSHNTTFPIYILFFDKPVYTHTLMTSPLLVTICENDIQRETVCERKKMKHKEENKGWRGSSFIKRMQMYRRFLWPGLYIKVLLGNGDRIQE